jgi:DNA-binding response OmpR family regulator
MPVLVVDSNAAAANELRENLRRSGFEVDLCAAAGVRADP